jgi:transposase
VKTSLSEGINAVLQVLISEILLVDGTYPRSRVNEVRVATYAEIYSLETDDSKIFPPVKLYPIVNAIDNSAPVGYAITDGLHRMNARKSLALTTISAIVMNHPIEQSKLDTQEVKDFLLVEAVKSAVGNGAEIQDDELGPIIVRLYTNNMSIDKLIENRVASRNTIYKHLKPVLKEKADQKNKERDENKKKCLAMHDEGRLTTREIAKNLGVSHTTIERWVGCNAGGKGNGNLAQSSQAGTNVPDLGNASEPQLSASSVFECVDEAQRSSFNTPGDGANAEDYSKLVIPDFPDHEFMSSVNANDISDENKKKLEDIYELIRTIDMTDAVQEQFKSYILPLLTKRSPVIAGIVENGGYALQMNDMKSHYSSLKNDFVEITHKYKDAQDIVETLKDKLRVRTEHCSEHCRHAKLGVAREIDNSLEAILKDMKAHEFYLQKADLVAMCDADIASARELLEVAKQERSALSKQPESDLSKQALKDKDVEVAQIDSNVTNLEDAKKSLLRPAFVFLSSIAVAVSEGIVTKKTIKYWRQFEKVIKDSVFSLNKDIMQKTNNWSLIFNDDGGTGAPTIKAALAFTDGIYPLSTNLKSLEE